MELKDLILTPLFLIIVYLGLYVYRFKHLRNSPLKKYFIPAISLKFFGAIFIGLLYQFYYDGGDTYNYFTHGSEHIWNAFMDSPQKGMGLIFGKAGDYTIDAGEYSGKIWLFRDPKSYMIVRLSAVIGLFTYHTYTLNALIFTLISFTGIWSLFKVFCNISPKNSTFFAYGFLFMPTVIFWGSGLMKDSICFGGLGWFITASYFLFFKKKISLKYIFLFVLGFLTVASIKPYILYSFFIAFGMWLTFTYYNKIRSIPLRFFFMITLLFTGTLVMYLTLNSVTEELTSISNEAQVKYGWIQHVSKKSEGAVYTFSADFDGSLGSFFRLSPEAFFTTWFRPFLWEAHNPLSLLMSLECLIYLFFLIQMLSKIRNYKILTPHQKGTFWMCITYAIIFGIIVGISTGNFGALQRYKVPGMPLLFSAFLLVIYAKKKDSKKQLYKND